MAEKQKKWTRWNKMLGIKDECLDELPYVFYGVDKALVEKIGRFETLMYVYYLNRDLT